MLSNLDVLQWQNLNTAKAKILAKEQMIEYLDIYNEDGTPAGRELRAIVHEKGLWHNTVHLWILRDDKHILFQMRAKSLKDNPGKLYTSASGHVASGDSLVEAITREAAEELGLLDIKQDDALFIERGVFTADFLKTDGTEYHDRVWYNMFFLHDDHPLTDYDFQEAELNGLYSLPIEATLNLLKTEQGEVSFRRGQRNGNQAVSGISNDFLFAHDTPMKKFGQVLEKALKHF